MFVWTCAYNEACRQRGDRFERSLDTISRKVSHVADVMQSFANSILVSKGSYLQFSATGHGGRWEDADAEIMTIGLQHL